MINIGLINAGFKPSLPGIERRCPAAPQSHIAVAHILYRDIETRSEVSLKTVGADKYAADPSTEVLCVAYAIDEGEVQTWHPVNPVPAPFANPADFLFVSDNFAFEPAIYESILVRRYGFPPIPLENSDCAERRAIAASYPAELGLRCIPEFI
jgi:DNA polymerase